MKKITTTTYLTGVLFIIMLNIRVSGYAQAWTTIGSAGFSAGISNVSHLAFNGSTAYVAYEDKANHNKISVMKFNGSNWVQVGPAGFSKGATDYLSIAFNAGTPYVAFSDSADSYKVSVMMFDGTNWNYVGNEGLSLSQTYDVCLAFSKSIPYVAFAGAKAMVMKYNGAAWDTVGNGNFSNGAISFTSFTFDDTIPYIAFTDNTAGTNIDVMTLSGSTWTTVGTSTSKGTYSSIAVNRSTPYMAFINSSGGKVSVVKFVGGNWVTVGAASFSAGSASYPTLAFNDTVPYVAYQDQGNSSKASVMKFDGSNWVQVGKAGFSAGKSNYTSLAFDGTAPYVAYVDYGNSQKVTVMGFICVMTASITSRVNATCDSLNAPGNGSIKVTESNGNGNFNYTWSNGTATSNTGSVVNTISSLTGSRTYTVTVTDVNSCTAVTSAGITQPVVLTESIGSQTNISCNGGANGSATITTSGGIGVLSYSWTPSGGIDVTASGLNAGTYTVIVKDTYNCTTSTSIAITEPSALILLVSAATPICVGQTETLSATATGGVSAYSYIWQPSGPVVSPVVPTTYSVYVVDANGCSTSAQSVSVSVNPVPDLTTSVSGVTITANETTATYQWIDCSTKSVIAGETDQGYTATVNGSYAVVITKNTCSDTSACVSILTTGIQSITNSNKSIMVYPNPNNGTFIIESATEGVYTIVNELGQSIQSVKLNGTNNYTMNIENLSNGIYFVVGFNNKLVARQKIVVTK